MLSQENIRSPIMKCRRNWSMFFVMEILPREDHGAIEFWRLNDCLRNHFEQSQHWSDEKWKKSRRKTKQENIPVLYWFIRSNLVPPSSSRSFRTQSHWFFITGQCLDSDRLLRVHLSRWMCDQFTFHHEFRIDTRRTKFKQGKTGGILYGCESHGQRTQRSRDNRPDSTASCTIHADNVEETPKHGVLDRHQTCIKRKD